jgi:hypothetical protein
MITEIYRQGAQVTPAGDSASGLSSAAGALSKVDLPDCPRRSRLSAAGGWPAVPVGTPEQRLLGLIGIDG